MYMLIKYIIVISLLLFELLRYIKLFFTILYMQSPPLRILKPTPQLKIIQIVSNTWNMFMLQVRISEYQQCTIYAQQQVYSIHSTENVFYLSPLVNTSLNGKSEYSYTPWNPWFLTSVYQAMQTNIYWLSLLLARVVPLITKMQIHGFFTGKVWGSMKNFLYVYFLYKYMDLIKIYPNMRLAKYTGDRTDVPRLASLYHFQICTKHFLMWTLNNLQINSWICTEVWMLSMLTIQKSLKSVGRLWFYIGSITEFHLQWAKKTKQSNLLLHERSKAFVFIQSPLQSYTESNGRVRTLQKINSKKRNFQILPTVIQLN